MTEAFEMLTKGQIFQSILQPFDAVIGIENFYLILIMVACALAYIKSRSPGLVGLMLMLTGAIILPVANPEMQKYFFGVVVVGFAISVYSVFRASPV